MIKITIYGHSNEEITTLQNLISDYAKDKDIIIKERTYFEIEEIINHKTDVCFINFSAYERYHNVLENWRKNNNIKFIFILNDINKIMNLLSNNLSDYFLLSVQDKKQIFKILDDIKQNIKKNTIVVKIPHNGEKRININDLNYINIVNRSLKYHLLTKELDSQTLRQSFSKEIAPLLIHPELYFIAPSLLINLTNIDILYNDHIIFKNNEILYFPKTAYANLRKAWKNYII